MQHTHSSRLVSVVLALVGAFALAACGSSTPPLTESEQEIFDRVKETAQERSALNYTELDEDAELEMNTKLVVNPANGSETSLSVDATILGDADTQLLHMTVDSKMQGARSNSAHTVMYGQIDGDSMTLYSDEYGSWQSQVVSLDSLNLSGQDVDPADLLDYLFNLQDVTVTSDKDSYTISGKISPDVLAELFRESGDLDIDGGSAELTVTADASSYQVFELTLDVSIDVSTEGESAHMTIEVELVGQRDANVDLEIPAEVLEAAGTAGAADSSSSDN